MRLDELRVLLRGVLEACDFLADFCIERRRFLLSADSTLVALSASAALGPRRGERDVLREDFILPVRLVRSVRGALLRGADFFFFEAPLWPLVRFFVIEVDLSCDVRDCIFLSCAAPFSLTCAAMKAFRVLASTAPSESSREATSSAFSVRACSLASLRMRAARSFSACWSPKVDQLVTNTATTAFFIWEMSAVWAAWRGVGCGGGAVTSAVSSIRSSVPASSSLSFVAAAAGGAVGRKNRELLLALWVAVAVARGGVGGVGGVVVAGGATVRFDRSRGSSSPWTSL